MLVPLVNHFGDIQQQMFDQFQPMMLQMFRTMHREQMEVIRAELDLHDLTGKNELANRTRDSGHSLNASSASKGLNEPMVTEPVHRIGTGVASQV